MADQMLNTAQKMMDTADQLRQSADTMADRRRDALKAGHIEAIEFRNNVVREGFMRHQVGEILLDAMSNVIGGINKEQTELTEAITKANATIKSIDALKEALNVFAALIGLAEAIALGKPQGILDAVQIVKNTTVSPN